MLRRLIANRNAFAPLFWTPYTESGHHTRRWLEEAMVRFCEAAGVTYVCSYALEGTAATLLAQTGEIADRIADHLSHEESATTSRHYLAPGAIEQAQASRAFAVIAGGKAGISSTISCAGGKTALLRTGGSSQNRTENLTRMKRLL